MKILSLDTSTDVCSAAIWMDGAVAERFESGNRHSEFILAMVDDLLAEAGLALTQLDAIAFGRGPGSFTGLRIAAGVAQGLAYGAGLLVVPVSSLAALAQGVDAPKVLAALDARMNQVYWGAYRKNQMGIVELEGDEAVTTPHDVVIPKDEGWTGAGSGWDQYHIILSQRLGNGVSSWKRQVYPRARHVAQIGGVLFSNGKAVPPELAYPVYLRDKVAEKKQNFP
ncbi:MAG: tRNA (adenosine(37)-N6)-threonylcarbamoyltransferase complex dimerization subunit type 1 TsaB [Sulfuricaulis sp.]|uniref:tRNA (adenosine(37)-N6)-threonylcarbamoyltransferase complex dimerization subunit type 1 TsaB n=1 Tax=Sulfuricaulis sp. TaxID=2003553 RepID=UPI0034A564AB